MGFMGAHVNIVLLAEGDVQECTNCVNAAKSNKPDRADTWVDGEGSTLD